MSSPFLSEDQCSHEFYSQVRNNFHIFPIRTHSTKIEAVEGVDVIYAVKNAMNRNVKAVLVQEKAPYPPPFEFVLEKHQHDRLLRRQSTFRHRAYFYAFFCVQNPLQLQAIVGNTVHFDVDKIPAFNSAVSRVRATSNPFYVYPNRRQRRGYHFVEILLRISYCWVGLPNRFFPELIEDLTRLVEENVKFYVAIYDKDERELSILFSSQKSDQDHNKE